MAASEARVLEYTPEKLLLTGSLLYLFQFLQKYQISNVFFQVKKNNKEYLSPTFEHDQTCALPDIKFYAIELICICICILLKCIFYIVWLRSSIFKQKASEYKSLYIHLLQQKW